MVNGNGLIEKNMPIGISWTPWGRPREDMARVFTDRGYTQGSGPIWKNSDYALQRFYEIDQIEGEGTTYMTNFITLAKSFIYKNALPDNSPLDRHNLSRLLDDERDRMDEEIRIGERKPNANWANNLTVEQNWRRKGQPVRIGQGLYEANIGDENVIIIPVDHYDVASRLGGRPREEDLLYAIALGGMDEIVQEAHIAAANGAKGYRGNLDLFKNWKKAVNKPVEGLGIRYEGSWVTDDWTSHHVILPRALAKTLRYKNDGTPVLPKGTTVLANKDYTAAYEKWNENIEFERANGDLEQRVLEEGIPGIAIVNSGRTINETNGDLVMAGPPILESSTSIWSRESVHDDPRVRKLIDELGPVHPDDLIGSYNERMGEDDNDGSLKEMIGDNWIRNSKGLLVPR